MPTEFAFGGLEISQRPLRNRIDVIGKNTTSLATTTDQSHLSKLFFFETVSDQVGVGRCRYQNTQSWRCAVRLFFGVL
jgi:hypothetical protein